ncbi:MAG: hypothetical protein J07HB67_02144 [halophilic archaeon J07HB67]|nr:MAG: hypothetical protein J07HB67_02144 [halophilic archaeon J07HB67]
MSTPSWHLRALILGYSCAIAVDCVMDGDETPDRSDPLQ